VCRLGLRKNPSYDNHKSFGLSEDNGIRTFSVGAIRESSERQVDTRPDEIELVADNCDSEIRKLVNVLVVDISCTKSWRHRIVSTLGLEAAFTMLNGCMIRNPVCFATQILSGRVPNCSVGN
jgi:hypothetical protein